MIRAGALVDTGPLVALLSRADQNHERARALMARCQAPLRTCESVIAEACFLLRRVDPVAPAELVALGLKGLYEIAFSLNEHWLQVETCLRKYRRVPASLADACLIRCAEVFNEPHILTFDSDFQIYRWGRNKRFEVLS